HKDALSGIIAIDGRDGAGKSCLAKRLCNLIGGDVVSLDCFLQQKNQGAYVRYLDLAAIKAAIERCATPKIIEGDCVLEVLNSIVYKWDVLIYVKEIYFGYYWKDEDILDSTEPIEKLIGALASRGGLKEEVIRYHDKYRPSRQAKIIFLRPHRH